MNARGAWGQPARLKRFEQPMKFLNYPCPVCNGRMRIRLLHSTDTCATCATPIALSPNPFEGKIFYFFNLICSLLIGWVIGEIRMSSGETFGMANLCADVLLYLIFFCALRIVVFQFQTPHAVTT